MGGGPPGGGFHNVGDIVWNNNPQPGAYIGWACTVQGTPGTWNPFGLII
jgi:hypothetical protein